MKPLLKTLHFYKAIGYKFIDDSCLNIPNLDDYSDISQIQKAIKNCQLCNFAKTRKNAVCDDKTHAKIMLIFKSPSISDDENGKPLSGKLGSWLKEILVNECKFNLNEVYFSYVIKCINGQNKEISKDNLLKCTPYLFDEIEKINPKIIITFGEVATHAIINSLPPLEISHGSIFRRNNAFVVPIFSLNFISKNPSKKDIFLQDFKKISKLQI